MKKVFLILALTFTTSLVFTSCRDEADRAADDIEDTVDDVGDEIEDIGDDLE